MIKRVIHNNDCTMTIEYIDKRFVSINHGQGEALELLSEILGLYRFDFKALHRTGENSFVVTFHDALSLEFFSETPRSLGSRLVKTLNRLEDTAIIQQYT